MTTTTSQWNLVTTIWCDNILVGYFRDVLGMIHEVELIVRDAKC